VINIRLWLVLLSVASMAVARADAAPNIVYLLADDLGYGDVHCLNPQRGKIPTPHFDRLATQGMVFTDAHSGSSVCTPTRYGVLTGRYAWRTRLQQGVLDDYVAPLIAADRLTVPALLRRQGYHTACIGKWHLGFTVDQPGKGGAPLGARTADGPTTRGFDHFYGYHHARMMKSVFLDDRVTEIVAPVDMLAKLTRHATDYVAARAKTGKPFFLYFALNSPHTPILPTKEWQGRSGLGAYGDYVMETDWAVGEVLAALDQAGVAGNTLVIATSDNGCSPAAGVDKLESQGHYPSAQFRGYKSDIWDGGHRIPFIVRWPRHVKPGSTCGQLTCLTDLLATCADILGVKLPDNAGEDSLSLLPLLNGGEEPGREAVVHHSIKGMFSIRQGPWKFILGTGSGGWSEGGDGAPVQLYEMTRDIGERTNQRAARPEVVRQLMALMERYLAAGRSTPGAPQPNDVTPKPGLQTK
jgi:arylsulfatase A